MSRFLQKSLNSSAGDHTIWTSPRMRSEGFLFMSAGLGVELCLPTVVLRALPFPSTPPFPTVRMKEENKFLWGSCKKCVWESEVLRGCILRCRRNTLLTVRCWGSLFLVAGTGFVMLWMHRGTCPGDKGFLRGLCNEFAMAGIARSAFFRVRRRISFRGSVLRSHAIRTCFRVMSKCVLYSVFFVLVVSLESGLRGRGNTVRPFWSFV